MASPRRVNVEYLRLFKEFVLLSRLALTRRPEAPDRPKSILIVVPCLIGEFAAAIPAIADFAGRHRDAAVDLVVTPALRPLARRIRGVREVYAVASVYGRSEEGGERLPEREYDLTIALRMSRPAFEALRRTRGAVRTSAWPIMRYGIHLFFSTLLRRTPRQWRAFNFELLGGVPREIPFDDMLAYTADDAARAAAAIGEREAGKAVLVHTGSSWPMKHWEPARWVELLGRLNASGEYRFIFVGGGAGDLADYDAIARGLGFKTASLIGRLAVDETLAVMRQAHCFVGVDSGPANLARLAELPNLTIYGPGPHMYLPFRTRDIALDKSRGRGLLEMFVYHKRNFISRITADEAYDAFHKLCKN